METEILMAKAELIEAINSHLSKYYPGLGHHRPSNLELPDFDGPLKIKTKLIPEENLRQLLQDNQ